MPFLTSVMPTIFFVGFFLMFFAIFGITIYSIIKGVAAKKRDDAAPVLDVWARVTGKRCAPPVDDEYRKLRLWLYGILCNLSSGERRPHGARSFRRGIRPAPRRG